MTGPLTVPTASLNARVIRGHIVTVVKDPFLHADALLEFTDGAVVIENNLITAVGSFHDLEAQIPVGARVDSYPGALISAGFVDSHVHYVQVGMMAAFGEQLLDWLDTYIFAEEERFADYQFALAKAGFFLDQLLANGTTSALVFCATYRQSVDALFEQASKRKMHIAAGKVLMDRNAPASLLDTAESGYRESAALISRWHGVGRNQYAVTPRFAPTSTREQLAAAGTLLQENPTTLLHTHLSENRGEVAWVQELFPESSSYLNVYARYGMLRPGAVFAHGVHLGEADWQQLADSGSAVAHCPSSNLFLGSGMFSMRQAKQASRPVTVGIGTDVGAGTSLSMLQTLNETYKVAQADGYALNAARMLFLATLGGAQALGASDQIGSIEPGKHADLVILDPGATDLLAQQTARAESVEELLFILSMMGDDRAVQATYVAGELVYRRDSVFGHR